MVVKKIAFHDAVTEFYFAGGISHLKTLTDRRSAIVITDEHVFAAHEKKFKNWRTIVLKPGEKYKTQETVNDIIRQLIEMEADRQTLLVGVGGGVVTDITGYVASVYMRGIRFGFIPTTLLALVDASIGGKNGIDIGVYKNMVGVIRQPSFILHDLVFLNTLPEEEWSNGFAEIIKHSCIHDARMFSELEKGSVKKYKTRKTELCNLVQTNSLLKAKVVQRDEWEKGERKLLNFGHTIGHAIENKYGLMHGEAVAIGMSLACQLSATQTGFKQTDRVTRLIEQYGLPSHFSFDKEKVFEILVMDKKRVQHEMNFILLNKIGKGIIKSIPLTELKKQIDRL